MSPTVEVLTANYYDDYRFSWAPSTFPSTVEGQAVSYNNQNLPKGLPTGSWTRILSGANDTNGLVSYTLYDAKARAIRSYSTNHIGGHDMVDTQYNFIGDVVKTLAHHQSSSENLDVEDTFSYTAQGRLDKHKQQFDGCTLVTLSENRYDALGQLESKEVGDGLQTVDYKYNVRGWLTDINDIGTLDDDLFAFKISYEGLSNGNISRTQWKTAMDNRTRRYDYTYDALNRLLDAEYSSDLGTSSYNESLNYDENGNIIGLLRRGLIEDHELQITMDNLGYGYSSNSNQLLSVYDATGNPEGFDDGNTSGDDYDYDVYGNMVEDANKYIANISYNHLNLPKQITIAGPSVAEQGTIDYLYAANGTKLRKKVDAVSGMQIDYVGSFYYEDSSLKFVNHAEGYLEEGRNGWRYVYQYKDHLGNIRLSYSDLDGNGLIDSSSEILEENNYYPFGLEHKGYNNVVNGTENNYKTYQGQELTEDLGLSVHEWKYRWSDPAIGRFWQVDPLAEKYIYNGVYNFSENRVIDAVELEGLEAYLLHGTGNWDANNYFSQNLQDNLQSDYGSFQSLAWSGSILDDNRISEADRIADEIIADLPNHINSEGKFDTPILLGGHSHGGNVARIASKKVLNYLTDSFVKGDIQAIPEIHLLMMNTPTMAEEKPFPLSGKTDYNFNVFQNAMIETIQVDADVDIVAGAGQFFSDRGSLNTFYSNTNYKIEYEDQYKDWSLPSIGNHNGHLSDNVKTWYPVMKENLKKENK